MRDEGATFGGGRGRALAAALGLVLVLALAPAQAAAFVLTWTGGSSNDWATPTNWDLNQAPQTGDDLILTLSGFPPSNNNLVGVQLHSVTLSADPNPLNNYTIGGNSIALQSGGSITSHHSAGSDQDNINAGVTLNGPATFTLTGTHVLNFNGSITGTGGLTLVNNSGFHNQLRLAGANTYAGTTTIAGTHRIHAFFNGAIPTTSAVTINSAGISFNTSSTIGSLAGVGVVTETGAFTTTTLTVGGDDSSTTYAGVLQNGTLRVALTKAGTGTLTLSGANTYTGATTVNAGTLLVTGSLAANSAVTVANGGTLGGTGTIGGSVTAQLGGRLAPGTSIGTLTVGGAVTWHGAATPTPTALFELSTGAATSDRLAITGALTKGGGPTFLFDFLGTGDEADYTLATFASTTFTAANFSYVNLAPGLVGTFSIVGNALHFTVSAAPPPTHDFNSDLKADILWRDTTGGLVALWLMNGLTIDANLLITTVPTTWSVAGVGDFNGDDDADIFWRNADGSLALWLMNGATIGTNASIAPVPPVWIVAGLGDFNGDGLSDVLWLNTSNGQVAIWLMNGTTPIASALIATVATTRVVAGVGDFDGDGLSDILWRDTAGGQVEIWLMNGFTITAVIPLPTIPTVWTIAGVGDFNGDGVTDILWRETSTGQVDLWLMNGTVSGTTSIASVHTVGFVPTVWTVALVQDFNGDAHADILWRESDGTVAMWLMNGPTLIGSGIVAEVPTNWVPE